MKKNICFIGSGKMAESIINGIIMKNIFAKENIFCLDIDNERLKIIKNKYNVKTFNIENIIDFFDDKFLYDAVIFLSIKPNNFIDVSKTLKNLFTQKNIDTKKLFFMSIMAGKRIETITKALSSENSYIKLIRIMPNTPSLIGEGAIGYSFSKNIEENEKTLAEKILFSIGECINVDENDLDAITSLSGSGPAYLFYLAEAMIESGVNMGLSLEVSKKLTIKTLFGASKMLTVSKDSPTILRKNVTSKGGTTEAAINYFDEKNMKSIIKEALSRAQKKSIELS